MRVFFLLLMVLCLNETSLFAQRQLEKPDSTNRIRLSEPDSWFSETRIENRNQRDVKIRFMDLYLGFNPLLQNGSTTFRGAERDLQLRVGQSIHTDLQFFPTRINLVGRKFNLLTAAALDIQHYRWDRNITLLPDRETLGYTLDAQQYERNRLRVLYFKVPVLLNFTSNPDRPNRGFSFSVGGFASLLAHADYVQKSDESGKTKVRDRFNLNQFQYGLAGQMGWKFLHVYANYSFAPFFTPNEGPRLNGLQVGVRLLGI